MAAGAKGRDDITPGIAGAQEPQPCLETGAGRVEGLGGGWVIPGLIPLSSGLSPL